MRHYTKRVLDHASVKRSSVAQLTLPKPVAPG
jgi:hypothetical protein